MGTGGQRRPIRARSSRWAMAVSRWLTLRGIAPNGISLASLAFAGAAGSCLVSTRFLETSWLQTLCYLLVPPLILGRLLCNLFDGMVAIEGGKQGKAGGIFNELPDRFADAMILVAAGYAAHNDSGWVWLGWLAALLAAMTAYVRLLGGACGTRQFFDGPMAKQHRMHFVSAGSLMAAVLGIFESSWPLFSWILGLIGIGCVATVWRRLGKIMRNLADS